MLNRTQLQPGEETTLALLLALLNPPLHFYSWPKGHGPLETQQHNSKEIKLSSVSQPPVGPPEILPAAPQEPHSHWQ